MRKYKIGMGQYSNAIKMEAFYEFLCSIPLDDLEDIEKCICVIATLLKVISIQ